MYVKSSRERIGALVALALVGVAPACGLDGERAGERASAVGGQVIGIIDGVLGVAGAQYIQGWACEPGNPNPLTVHLYTGGGAGGAGQIFDGFVANGSPGEAGVSAACGTSTGHRFFINVTGDVFD